MTDTTATRPYRVETTVEQYAGDPEAGPPDRVVRAPPQWFEGNGDPIDDGDRIAELEARVTAREEQGA